MKRQAKRADTSKAPRAKRARKRGPEAALSIQGPPEIGLFDIPKEVLWHLVYPQLGVRGLLRFAETSKQNAEILDDALFMADFLESRLLFAEARTLRLYRSAEDSVIRKIYSRTALRQLGDFGSQFMDDSDLIVLFQYALRDREYRTEENEAQLILREEEAQKRAEADAMATGDDIEVARLISSPMKPPLHPFVLIRRLKEQFLRLAFRDVTFYEYQYTPDEVRWSDELRRRQTASSSDDEEEAPPMVIPEDPDWPMYKVRHGILDSERAAKPNDHKRLVFRVMIDEFGDKVGFTCGALWQRGPREDRGLLRQGFSLRGTLEMEFEFSRATSVAFREEFRTWAFKNHPLSIPWYFDDFRDETRLERVMNSSIDYPLLDPRVKKGMTKREVIEIFGPLTPLTHLPALTFKTYVKSGKIIGDCFFRFVEGNSEVLEGIRWQFTAPTQIVSPPLIRTLVRFSKENFARLKVAFGNPVEKFGKLTIGAVNDCLESQHSILPIRALVALFPGFGLGDSTNAFCARFRDGARFSVACVFLSGNGGRLEFAVSFVPFLPPSENSDDSD